MYLVVVVDKQQERCRAWAGRIAELSNRITVYAYCRVNELRRYERAVFGSSDSTISKFDLALRHYRDEDIEFPYSTELEIWYGGNGAELTAGKDWNVHLSVAKSRDVTALDSSAIRELLRWAQEPDRKACLVPSLLAPTITPELLQTLTILCQGYLACYAVSGFYSREDVPTIVRAALEQMGLFDTIDYIQHLESSLCTSFDRVQLPEWWLEALSFRNEVPARKDDLVSIIRKEWNEQANGVLPIAIDSFVAKLFDDSARVTDPERVAEVHCLLAGHFGGKHCNP